MSGAIPTQIWRPWVAFLGLQSFATLAWLVIDSGAKALGQPATHKAGSPPDPFDPMPIITRAIRRAAISPEAAERLRTAGGTMRAGWDAYIGPTDDDILLQAFDEFLTTLDDAGRLWRDVVGIMHAAQMLGHYGRDDPAAEGWGEMAPGTAWAMLYQGMAARLHLAPETDAQFAARQAADTRPPIPGPQMTKHDTMIEALQGSMPDPAALREAFEASHQGPSPTPTILPDAGVIVIRIDTPTPEQMGIIQTILDSLRTDDLAERIKAKADQIGARDPGVAKWGYADPATAGGECE
jgi:hypothetical protein